MLADPSPAELLQVCLESLPQGMRRQFLRLAKHDNEQLLKELDASRLAHVEQGRDDEWQQQADITKETLAAIAQELAAC